MKSIQLMAVTGLMFAMSGLPAFAHAALLSCYDNEDGTIDCEAGYSDGATSAGQSLLVLRDDQRLLHEFTFDETGVLTFDKPDTGFIVEFHGDSSHIVTVYGEDITP